MILTKRIADVLRRMSQVKAEVLLDNGVIHVKSYGNQVYVKSNFEIEIERPQYIDDIQGMLKMVDVGSEVSCHEEDGLMRGDSPKSVMDLTKEGIDYSFTINKGIVDSIIGTDSVLIKSDGSELSFWTKIGNDDYVKLVGVKKDFDSFSAFIEVRNIKHLERSKTLVQICHKGAVQFTSANITTIVALESNSAFNA